MAGTMDPVNNHVEGPVDSDHSSSDTPEAMY